MPLCQHQTAWGREAKVGVFREQLLTEKIQPHSAFTVSPAEEPSPLVVESRSETVYVEVSKVVVDESHGLKIQFYIISIEFSAPPICPPDQLVLPRLPNALNLDLKLPHRHDGVSYKLL